MSINSALNAGVTGLAAYSANLAAVSDNIANVNTVGYKRNVTDFSTIITDTGSGSQFSAGGVTANVRSVIAEEGLLLASTSTTDLAIAGAGFFVVSRDPNSDPVLDPFLFTRAGSFTQDENGFLRNAAGLYLQGWPVDANGNIPVNPSDLTTLQPISLNQLGGTAEATTTVGFNANLQDSQPISADEATYDATVSGTNMASGTVVPDFQRSVQVFDSKGGFRTLTFSFLKSATPNQWHAEIHVVPASDVQTGAPFIDGQVATGIVAFNPNGTFDDVTSTLPTTLSFLDSATAPGAGQIGWATALGVDSQTIDLQLGAAGSAGGLTQFNSASTLLSTQVNGTIFGALSGVTIDKQGFVTAAFDNGILRRIYQLPVATFVNPNGLRPESGNAYGVTPDSGTFNMAQAGIGTAGEINSGNLEASTVDLAKEFTELIKTQRAYSASTRIITTADEMLAELIQLKR